MDIKKIEKELSYKPANVYDNASDDLKKEITDYCEGYKNFLDNAKTERMAVKKVVEDAIAKGYKKYDPKKAYKPGEKIYYNNRGKSVILAVIGKEPMEKGFHIAAAHIDSPRLDLKPRPLYEQDDIAYFKTHYYGGIKKYQWTCIPLALYGIVAKKDGTTVEISIGDAEGDPQFYITDLLPHLAKDQYSKPLDTAIPAENLNLVVGSMPFGNDEKSKNVKLGVLKILNEKYGITESDFLSAEIEAVPAYKATDIGFDRSLIAAYAQDDRVCAYPAYTALLDAENPVFTSVAVLSDKEEIGSTGNTGLSSDYLKNFLTNLCRASMQNELIAFENSKCLSADVNGAYDPAFADVFEKNNSSFINAGAVLTKYTGARGKSSTSDASAETMGYFRNLFDENGVIWQIGELGKTDQGGGGTVAQFIASMNIDVVDLGVAVLSMHAPFELTAKADVYMTYKACKALFDADK